jgi:exopolysaccharide biosynthesis polyprenyl glycosylphosphotransferase
VRYGDDVGQQVAGAPRSTSYVAVSTLLSFTWLAVLALHRSYEPLFIGAGAEEYRRVATASVRLWGAVAIGCYVAKVDLGRGFVAVAFPLGLALLWLSRWTSRRWLHRIRARTGGWSHRVLVMGDRAHAAPLVAHLQAAPAYGYHVIGVCLLDDTDRADVNGVAVLGSTRDVAPALARARVDTVAVAAAAGFTAPVLRRLFWELEQTDVDVVVAPALTDVAGPRIHIRPVEGLPLLHVAQPEFTGMRRVFKEAFDRAIAAVILVLLFPLMVATAIAVRATSRGPVLFRQQRIGKAGKAFSCFKFRTMVEDADARLDGLVGSDESRVLFKLSNDPRVTPLGHVLRRYSIDELPQLVNVLKGDMSLVGPRPQVQAEVDLYTSDYRRRLLVKPGITGLWQVSGRSDLTYEESERLDLYYVENWSLTADLMILWRTFRAVVKSSGAY